MALEQVKKVLDRIKDRDYDSIYYVSCGGSSALMYPSQYYVDAQAKKVRGACFNADEFIHRNPAALGEKSIVITCSQEGETPETVKAMRFARSKGATIISIAMVDGSALEKEADLFVKYGYYETAKAIDTSYGVMYLLTAGILEAQEKRPFFEGMVQALQAVQPVIEKAKQDFVEKAEDFARRCQNAEMIYSISSGSNYSQSYVMCNCYLMEMQWINAIPIHAGEFFHGPFEIIEKSSPVVLLMGLDNTRTLEERALKFCEKYTDELFVIDMKQVNFGSVSKEYQGVVAPLVINNICRLYCKTIAKVRDHSLDIRRYMHIVEY